MLNSMFFGNCPFLMKSHPGKGIVEIKDREKEKERGRQAGDIIDLVY